MASASKVKGNNSISQAVAASELVSSVNAVSAGQAEIFSQLFNQLQVQDVQAQTGTDQKQTGPDQDASAQAKDAKEVRKDAGPKTAAKGDKADGEDKKVRSGDDDGDEEEMSVEEKSELEEIDKYRMSLEELAKQLNVALAAVPEQRDRSQNIKIVVEGQAEQVKAAAETIDPRLLRQVDVEALDRQLEKCMKGRDLLEVEVPKGDGGEAAQAFTEIMSGAYRPEFGKDGENEDMILSNQSEAEQALAEDRMNLAADGLFEERMLALNDKNRELRADAFAEVKAEAKGPEIPEETFLDTMRDQSARNAMLSQAAGERRLETKSPVLEADFVAASLKSFAEKGRLDLTQTASPKQFEFQAGADATPQTGATPSVEHLFLKPVSTPASSVKPADFTTVKPGEAQTTEPLDAGDVVQIKAKVQMSILGMAKDGKSESTRIQLHPETLGKIDIKITMKDKLVSAEIVTDNAMAKEALLQHMPQIREALASENLMLDYFNARHDDSHFQAAQQQAFAGSGEAGGREGAANRRRHEDDAAAVRAAEAGGTRRKVARESVLNITV